MQQGLFTNLFEGKSMDYLQMQKLIYESLLDQQSPNFIPPVNKKTGRPLKPAKMPWMIPAWTRGLNMVIEAIKKATE